TSDPLAQQMLKIVATTPERVAPPDTGYPPEQAGGFYEMVGKILTGKLAWDQSAAYWSKAKADLAREGLYTVNSFPVPSEPREASWSACAAAPLLRSTPISKRQSTGRTPRRFAPFQPFRFHGPNAGVATLGGHL